MSGAKASSFQSLSTLSLLLSLCLCAIGIPRSCSIVLGPCTVHTAPQPSRLCNPQSIYALRPMLHTITNTCV